MKFDLHMHSKYSDDGEFTPSELIVKAQAKGIDIIALSDHNQVSGVKEMIAEGEKAGMKVLPAIECDTQFHGFEVHVLGYGIDYEFPYFKDLYAKIAATLTESTKQRLELFEKHLGIKLDIERLLAISGDSGNLIGILDDILNDERYKDVELMKPFMEGGSKWNTRFVDFYWEFCGKGGPCYIAVEYPSLKATVEKIHQAGGIAMIAHPWTTFYKQDDLLKEAIDAGIDGLEAYSNYHESEHNAFYEKYCKNKKLAMSCGSDFHGKVKPSISIGEYGYLKDTQDEDIQNFLKYLSETKPQI